MSAGKVGSDAAAFCAALVREHDFGRYASALFVAPQLRRALLSLYAFNVEISRIRDQVSQPLPGEIRLQWWSDMLTGQAAGAEGNPVATELQLTIRESGLPVERLLRLIDEHQFDLYNDPMPTMAALDGYLNDTSAALFALGAGIAAPSSAEVDHLARHAGLAHGIVQLLVALPRDAAHRQLFVPAQLLDQHGSGMEEMFAGRQTPSIRAALNELAGTARQHLEMALQLLTEAPREIRPVFLPLALVRRDLDCFAHADHDPYLPQPRSHLATLWTLWRASRSRTFRAE